MSNTYFNISDKLRLYEFDGMLDQYGDAAAAYSLRKLRSGYTGSAIRVRRSSDNTERDMGFYDNELDTVALLDWVNEDVVKYTSNFAVGGDNFGLSSNVSISLGESIGGENDALKATITGTGEQYIYKGPLTPGFNYKISGKFYIPSSNTEVNALRIANDNNNPQDYEGPLDQWVDFEFNTVAAVSYVIFRAFNGTSSALNATGDVFYLKDLVYTQTTADGFVHTWYDQSANANHAVQGTATAQPKIVDVGVVVEENGKPTITFDGVDDVLRYQGDLVTDSVSSIFTSLNVGSFGGFGTYIDRYEEPDDGTASIRSTSTADMLQLYSVETTNASYQNSQLLISAFQSSGSSSAYIDGVSVGAASNSANYDGISIGASRIRGSILYASPKMQEVILYNSDETSSRTDIESNINDYYDIY